MLRSLIALFFFVVSSGAFAYTVKQGDTLSQIAVDKCGSYAAWKSIANENRIRNPKLIRAEQTIEISCAKDSFVRVKENPRTEVIKDTSQKIKLEASLTALKALDALKLPTHVHTALKGQILVGPQVKVIKDLECGAEVAFIDENIQSVETQPITWSDCSHAHEVLGYQFVEQQKSTEKVYAYILASSRGRYIAWAEIVEPRVVTPKKRVRARYKPARPKEKSLKPKPKPPPTDKQGEPSSKISTANTI